MAVFAAAIMFAITAVTLIGGIQSHFGGEGHRGAVRERRPPKGTSVIPVLVVVGAVIGVGMARVVRTPPSPAAEQQASTYQAVLGGAPVYRGPSNGAPLPRLNLPITYDYGPGPRHPTPLPTDVPSSPLATGGTNQSPSTSPSANQPPVSPIPLPSCSSLSGGPPGSSGSGGRIVIGPCVVPT